MYTSLEDQFHSFGNPDGPLVICVHGIMGKVEDFRPFIDAWGKDFQLKIPDLSPGNALKVGYSERDQNEGMVLKYQLAPAMIIEYLERYHKGRKVFLVGISFGGKICFEVAQKIPNLVTGLCVTDVGLGPLCENSSLFQLAFGSIPKLNLKQDWPTLRKEIEVMIPDRMLRILIYNHIEYFEGHPNEGHWKSGANDFYKLLRNNDLEDQWANHKALAAPCKILKATIHSAIDDADFEKMKSKPNLMIDVIEGANHFLHVHMPQVFLVKTLEMLSTYHQKKES
jgi:pimeloyl-ACP methyl ester carboxylesterase